MERRNRAIRRVLQVSGRKQAKAGLEGKRKERSEGGLAKAPKETGRRGSGDRAFSSSFPAGGHSLRAARRHAGEVDIIRFLLFDCSILTRIADSSPRQDERRNFCGIPWKS